MFGKTLTSEMQEELNASLSFKRERIETFFANAEALKDEESRKLEEKIALEELKIKEDIFEIDQRIGRLVGLETTFVYKKLQLAGD